MNKRIYTQSIRSRVGGREMGLGVEIKENVTYIFSSFSWRKREKLELNMARCLHMLNMDGGLFFNPPLHPTFSTLSN